MSTTTPIPRELRMSDVLIATAGQTLFGPFDFQVFSADDVRIETRAPGADPADWQTATALTVTLTEPEAEFSLFTVTFDAGQTESTNVRAFGARLHSRLSDVTKGGAINSVALERELDKTAVVLQEVRRDVDLVADPANRQLFKGDPGQDGEDGEDGDDGEDGQDGAGLRVDDAGLKAERSDHDEAVPPFGYLATDTNEISVKLSATSGNWSAWVPLGSGSLLASNNLSDLSSPPTARTNLGLGNVDNTADADKPVSTAQQAAIDTAIAGLLDGAPGALDTLNELAAAINDDDSFAASVTIALAGKEPVNAELLKADTDDNLTAGYTSTAPDDGTISSGTYTPSPAGGNLRHYTNGGAHTFEAPTAASDYNLVIHITNNASAGAITLSGWDDMSGDDFTVTDGDKFLCFITKLAGTASISVRRVRP